MTLKTISALPTWLVVITVIKLDVLAKEHPFRNRTMLLSDWAKNRTPLCEFFDIVLWAQLVIFGFATYIITRG